MFCLLVEALLDELDNQVSSTKIVVQVRPPSTRGVPSNEQNGGVRPPSYRAVPSNEQNGGVSGGNINGSGGENAGAGVPRTGK